MVKIERYLEKILNTITTLLYFLLIVVVLVQIIVRFTPSITIPWTEEFTRLIFIYIICLGVPLSLKKEVFADVDLFTTKMPKKVYNINYVIIYLLIAIFCAVTFISGINFAIVGMKSLSPAMKLPMVIHYSSIAISTILCLLYSLMHFVNYLKKVFIAEKQ